MLVLSRRADEQVVFPSLGISINILRTNASNVRIGIDAPREIEVLRGELIENDHATKSIAAKSVVLPECLQKQTASMRSTIHQAADTLNRLHASAEQAEWLVKESGILELFGQLKSLDEQVGRLSNGQQNSSNAGSSQVGKRRAEGKVRALLVDDNDNESRLLSSYLRIKGVDVSLASNGQQALKQIEVDSPDVVLLDMNMPEFDGRWTIDRIRDDQQLQDLTVFAVSGTPAAESDVEVGPMGVNSWFNKPLNPENLVSAITERMDSMMCLS